MRDSSEEMRTLFVLLRTRTGVDFSLYKPGTLNRRIMRRMVLHKLNTVPDYIKFLQENNGEIEALFGDLLISVTGFFRDPSAFQTLQKKIFPRLVQNRSDDAPVRIWTCGCSTGKRRIHWRLRFRSSWKNRGSVIRCRFSRRTLTTAGWRKREPGFITRISCWMFRRNDSGAISRKSKVFTR